MSKVFKIFLLLAFVGGLGFYLGTRNPQKMIFGKKPDNTYVRIYSANVSEEAGDVIGSGVFHPNAITEVFSFKDAKAKASAPWYISRASAIASYLIMFFVIVWGAGMTTGFAYKITNPVKAWSVHQYMSIALGFTILTHVFSLLFDEFINFGIKDLLVPFASDFKPAYLSLGIISFYILLMVILSSLVLRIKTPKFWRALHYLVYPMFIFSLVHGLETGTDSSALLMRYVYWATGAIFAGVIFYRFIVFNIKKISLASKSENVTA